MRKLLNLVLIATFVIEAPVGTMLMFAPESFLPAGQIDGVLWARNYGVAAFAISTLLFWTWSSRDSHQTMGVTLGFLMTFHAILAIALLVTGGQLTGAVLHSILAVLSVVLYFRRAQWCVVEQH
jgi:hypothetical protein